LKSVEYEADIHNLFFRGVDYLQVTTHTARVSFGAQNP
jgi:hypothetical protein